MAEVGIFLIPELTLLVSLLLSKQPGQSQAASHDIELHPLYNQNIPFLQALLVEQGLTVC